MERDRMRLNFAWLRERDLKREAVMIWLRANNLDPMDIPIDADFVINPEAKTITVDVVDKDRNGKAKISKFIPNTVALKQVTVPMLVAWDDSILGGQPGSRGTALRPDR
jgi:hypothetical protein